MGEEPNKDVAGAAAGDVEKLKAEIEDTRAEIGETLEAIQERLAPANVARNAATAVKESAARRMEQMMTTAGDKASEIATQAQRTAAQVTEQVRDNALPAAVIAAGIGWLAYKTMSNGSGRRARSRERVYDPAYDWDEYGDRERYDTSGSWFQAIADHPVPAALASLGIGWMVQQITHQASGRRQWDEDGSELSGWRDSARDVADDARARVRDATERTTREVSRVSRRMSGDLGRLFRQNPIAFGVAAAAVGVAIGLSVPETETENELLGDTRDALVDRARDAASSAMQTLGG
jgi:ElaB/YqjD/DUF883 family membrane-anchored ribosome-binding protein